MVPARPDDDGLEQATQVAATRHHATKKKKKLDLVGLPVPISNPTIGSGLALTGLGLFQTGRNTPPSMIGAGVLRTSNGTHGAGLLGKYYFADHPWRLDAVAARGNLNLDFYGTGAEAGRRGTKIPLNEDATLVELGLLRRFTAHIYGGLRVRGANVDISIRAGAPPQHDDPPLPWSGPHLRAQIRSLDLLFEYDTRDNTFYPTQGRRFNLVAAFPNHAMGSDLAYRTVHLDADGYWSLDADRRWVLAARAAACRVSTRTPFFSSCQFGQKNDLRGYVVGRYRDDALFALQAELRWRGAGRFGLVGFAGAGNVGPDLGHLRLGHPLTSFGVGLRYLASKQNQVNVGIDVARAGGGNSLYFRIGEAF